MMKSFYKMKNLKIKTFKEKKQLEIIRKKLKKKKIPLMYKNNHQKKAEKANKINQKQFKKIKDNKQSICLKVF